MKHGLDFILGLVILFIIIQSAAAESPVEIISIFSDENSMDVTLQSHTSVTGGRILFKLMHKTDTIETQTVDFDMVANSSLTRVIMWNSRPEFETYEARAFVYVGDTPAVEAVYPFSYGFVVLPRFQVADISADSSGVNLVLKPRSSNPAVSDFTFQLIRNGDIVYSENKDNIPVLQPALLSITWPVLLDDHTRYIVRVKAYSHTPDIISSYTTMFNASQQVEIDDMDVEVDDFGASVTLLGKSQVPFEGIVDVVLQKDGNTQLFSGKPDILTLNRDDTVGIVWDDLEPGNYHVFIYARTLDGEILDRYETVLSIPEPLRPNSASVPTQTPGFGVLISIFSFLVLALLAGKK